MGYAWIGLLILLLGFSARSAYRRTLPTEEFPHSCDPFGYLIMAKDIRRSAADLKLPNFGIQSMQTRLLIDLMQSKELPPREWNNVVAPHAHHYFPKADRVGVQYPPGTAMALSIFPEGRAVYGLNLVVVSFIAVTALAALLFALVTRSYASAGLIFLAAFVAFEILGRLGSLSFSINVVMVPMLLSCLLSIVALWLRNVRNMPRLAMAAAFGVGICLGFAILVRVVSVFSVPAFLILLWPRQWRRGFTGLPAVMCLAVLLSGFVPLFISQKMTGGSWYESTYAPSVQPNLPTREILRNNFHYYFGNEYQSQDNWSLLYVALGFVGWAAYLFLVTGSLKANKFDLGVPQLALAAAVAWLLPTAFFLTQSLVGLHYLMAQTFTLLMLIAMGTLAVEALSQKHFPRDSTRKLLLASAAFMLAALPAAACFKRMRQDPTMPPVQLKAVAHTPVVLPAELQDDRAWIWADLLTGTLWYYDQKPAFRIRFGNPSVREMVYRYVQTRGDRQYIILDSEFIDEMMKEITKMGGTFEPRGYVDGQPYFLIHWPQDGPHQVTSSNQSPTTTG